MARGKWHPKKDFINPIQFHNLIYLNMFLWIQETRPVAWWYLASQLRRCRFGPDPQLRCCHSLTSQVQDGARLYKTWGKVRTCSSKGNDGNGDLDLGSEAVQVHRRRRDVHYTLHDEVWQHDIQENETPHKTQKHAWNHMKANNPPGYHPNPYLIISLTHIWSTHRT